MLSRAARARARLAATVVVPSPCREEVSIIVLTEDSACRRRMVVASRSYSFARGASGDWRAGAWD